MHVRRRGHAWMFVRIGLAYIPWCLVGLLLIWHDKFTDGRVILCLYIHTKYLNIHKMCHTMFLLPWREFMHLQALVSAGNFIAFVMSWNQNFWMRPNHFSHILLFTLFMFLIAFLLLLLSSSLFFPLLLVFILFLPCKVLIYY